MVSSPGWPPAEGASVTAPEPATRCTAGDLARRAPTDRGNSPGWDSTGSEGWLPPMCPSTTGSPVTTPRSAKGGEAVVGSTTGASSGSRAASSALTNIDGGERPGRACPGALVATPMRGQAGGGSSAAVTGLKK